MKAHTTELEEQKRMSWTATHEHLLTSGVVTFRKVSEDVTEITYHLEGHVTGHFTFLQDMVVSEKLGEVCRSFMKNIKARLEYNAKKDPKES